MQLTSKDYTALNGVHPDLVTLVRCVAVSPPIDFMVMEGVRTVEKQTEYVAAGTSQTMNSRHLTGHAVDLVPLLDSQPTWDWDYYYSFADHIKAMADALAVDVDWGGDWTSFKDGPHWELRWSSYPVEPVAPPPAETVEV
jgi:peptidoglycan LD-endopeptidase CwlK